MEDAKRFDSLSLWEKHSKSAVRVARKMGILEEATSHMTKNKKWSIQDLIEDAKKYSTRSEWAANSNAYHYAKRRKILDICCSHMSKPPAHNKKWNHQNALEEARKYKTRGEWIKKSSASYRYCRDNNLLDEARSQMPHQSGTSIPEKELFVMIKNKYPKAQTAWFQVKDPEFAPAKRFQLDIYIPELRKGIEFNGDYWHSFDGLARSRKPKGWTDIQIENYHELKKVFFQKKQIQFIEIWENDWKTNREQCLLKIFSFLEGSHGSDT
jgi:hypothetical protein